MYCNSRGHSIAAAELIYEHMEFCGPQSRVMFKCPYYVLECPFTIMSYVQVPILMIVGHMVAPGKRPYMGAYLGHYETST